MLKKQGLYLPEFEHDNCGAGFICSLTETKSQNMLKIKVFLHQKNLEPDLIRLMKLNLRLTPY